MRPIGDHYLEFTSLAFEGARRTSDWAPVLRMLADDAILVLPLESYGGGVHRGSAAFVAHHHAREIVLNRCFETAELNSWVLPVAKGDTMYHRLAACWRAPRRGLPDLPLEFEIRLTFEDDAVVRAEERWSPEARSLLHGYLREHRAALGCRPELLDLTPSAELQLLRRAMRLVERRVDAVEPTAATATHVQCQSTFSAPEMPDLHLEYGLEYRFTGTDRVDVEEHWTPAMRAQLRAHLDQHGAALRKRAADAPWF